MTDQPKAAVSTISIQEAIALLAAAEKENIGHVITLTRDPSDPSRILSIAAVEAASA